MLICVLLCLFNENINMPNRTVNKIHTKINRFVNLDKINYRFCRKSPPSTKLSSQNQIEGFILKAKPYKTSSKNSYHTKNRTYVRFFMITIFLLTKGKRKHFSLQWNGWSRTKSGNGNSCSSGCQVHGFRNRFSI